MACIEMSNDGRVLELEALTDCKMHFYEFIGGEFVITRHYTVHSKHWCVSRGGAFNNEGDFLSTELGGWFSSYTIVRHQQCSSAKYSEGEECISCSDSGCDLCLNETNCVRCLDLYRLSEGRCVPQAPSVDYSLVVVSTMMVSAVVCLLIVAMCCNFTGTSVAVVSQGPEFGSEAQLQSDLQIIELRSLSAMNQSEIRLE